MTSKLLLSVALSMGLILAASGCNSSQSEAPNAAKSSNQPDTENDHAGHDHGDGDQTAKTDMEKMTKALADFSEEDRKSAMKQHFCPVTDAMLGAMGKPSKVEVQGQQVWICCDGCKDKLKSDPEKYLAKLNK